MPSSMVWARRGAAKTATRRNGRTVEPRVTLPPLGSQRRKMLRAHSALRKAPLSVYFPITPTGAAGFDKRRGCPAGHAGPAHSQGAIVGADAWLGNHQPHSTDVAGRLPDRARVPVSRPPSMREPRLGDVVLADH